MYAVSNTELSIGLLVAVLLMLFLWGPYLFTEIVYGKDNKRRKPIGAGDTHPGHRGDPAPGQPDAQADPWQSGPPR